MGLVPFVLIKVSLQHKIHTKKSKHKGSSLMIEHIAKRMVRKNLRPIA